MIAVTGYGRSGGSSRVRVFDWIDALDLDAEVHDYIGSASASPAMIARRPVAVAAAELRLRALSNRRDLQSLLLSRSATPFSRGGIEARLLRRSSHGVYDVDDALHLDVGTGVRGAFSKAATWQACVRAADAVIVGNDFLAEAAHEFSTEISVIPSCVEPGRYQQKAFRHHDAPRTALWLGSPATEQYLGAITEPLLAEHARSGLRLRLISRGDAPLGGLERMTDRVAWSLDTFAADMLDADFGIMPLPDDQWSRGKCAYKLLQYAAAGLPTIGSPVGANVEALSRTHGYAVSTSAEWGDALRELADASPERLTELGDSARAGVQEHYSFRRWAPEWLRVVQP